MTHIDSVFLKSKICLTCNKVISGADFDEIKKHQEQGHEVVDDNRDAMQTLHDAVAPARSFVHNPKILDEIEKDLEGVHVGDKKNKVLALILLASSKRKDHEQAIIIQKISSAGGSNLQDSLLEYFDKKITLTRMTAAYLDRSMTNYAGKILAIGEMSGFDSGSSVIRQKLSEGKTELATTDKDEKGRIITNILRTEGRPSFITTTNSFEIHPEFENRCWILSIDETPNQTKAVNKYQFSKDRFEFEDWKPSSEIKSLLNSGILEDLRVVNPFAELLGESFPCDNVTARRDSKRFADLTTTITYLHQHQRIKIKTQNQLFIITSFEDLKLAIFYGQDALRNTLNKLDKKAESVIGYMKACSKEKELFTRNDLCNALEIPYETMKRILEKLTNRSFVQFEQVDRVWKYKLSNKSLIDGISFGSEEDFTKTAIQYLKKNASNFEQIILPQKYYNTTGVDKAIVDYLLSLNVLVTDQNSNRICVAMVPVTTSLSVRVTDTETLQIPPPLTTKIEEVDT